MEEGAPEARSWDDKTRGRKEESGEEGKLGKCVIASADLTAGPQKGRPNG